MMIIMSSALLTQKQYQAPPERIDSGIIPRDLTFKEEPCHNGIEAYHPPWRC
jgi:hypothetical protein